MESDVLNGGENPGQSQGQPMALTTDEATSATLAGTHSDRTGSEETQRTGSSGARNQRHQKQSQAQTASPTGRRVTSPGGGMQVTLDGEGSWSALARRDATLPADANYMDAMKEEGSGG